MSQQKIIYSNSNRNRNRNRTEKGHRLRLFLYLQHLGTVGLQSEHRKQDRFRTADDAERQEAPKNAEEKDRVKSGYIAA